MLPECPGTVPRQKMKKMKNMFFDDFSMIFHDFRGTFDLRHLARILPQDHRIRASEDDPELRRDLTSRLLGARRQTGYLGVPTMSLLSIALLKTHIYGV